MDYISSLKAVMGTVPPVTRLQPYISAARLSAHPALTLIVLLENHLDGLYWRASHLGDMAQNAAVLRNFCNEEMVALPEILGQLEEWEHEFPFLTELLNITGMGEPHIRNAYISSTVLDKLSAYVTGHAASVKGGLSAVSASMAFVLNGQSVTATATVHVVIEGVTRELTATVDARQFPDTMRAFIDVGEALFEFFRAQFEQKLTAPEFLPTSSELNKAKRDAAYHASCDILNALTPAHRERLKALLASNQDIFMVAARKVL
jgi:hypothetical protein